MSGCIFVALQCMTDLCVNLVTSHIFSSVKITVFCDMTTYSPVDRLSDYTASRPKDYITLILISTDTSKPTYSSISISMSV